MWEQWNISLGERALDSRPPAQEVDEPLESEGGDSGERALVADLVLGLPDGLFVGIVPNFPQVAVDLHALLIRHVQVSRPGSERLPAGVGVVTVLAGSLGNHPVDCHLDHIARVGGPVATGGEPLPVAATLALRLELPDQFQRGEGAARAPLDIDPRVSIEPYLLAEPRRGSDVSLPGAVATSPDFPGAGPFLDST